MITITPGNIAYAESILLPKGDNFDLNERLPFIKRFDTIDVQAVPGSGKTTALLAKLLLIEKSLPFQNGSGVLVLSHSNSAIQNIEEKIKKHCPKLFAYPNHVGTIQSFTDKYLAIPFYRTYYNKSPILVTPEYYKLRLNKKIDFQLYQLKNKNKLLYNKLFYIRRSYNPFEKMRLRVINGKTCVSDSILGDKLDFYKPKKTSKNYIDYTPEEKDEIHDWSVKLKKDILRYDGIINFEDAYFFADKLLEIAPCEINYLQERFKHVFIDEMQDMKPHEIALIEKIFFNGDKSRCFQRIGDTNQTIYSDDDFDENSSWAHNNREVISLSGTHRLCSVTANIVEKFGIFYTPINSLKVTSKVAPKLILYRQESINKVLPLFANIVQAHKTKYPELYDGRYPIKAIGWRRENEKGTSIKSYFPLFQDYARVQSSSACLWNDLNVSLATSIKNSNAFRYLRKAILNSLIRVLKDEGFKSHWLISTTEKLLSFLDLNYNKFFQKLNEDIYNWVIDLNNGRITKVHSELSYYISKAFLPIFGLTYAKSREYCENLLLLPEINQANENIYKEESTDFEIEIGTVHSAKGETHLATLYLETYFQNDGNKGISYESQRLSEQLKGHQIDSKIGKKRTKQSSKMVYVGFSRAKYLLCYAADSNHFDQETLNNMESLGWEINFDLL